MKKIEVIVEAVRKKVKKKKWKCMHPSCNKKSIKSHVLQKNGILNRIAKDKHLIQPFTPNLFHVNNSNIIDVGKIGLNKAFTFLGFCNEHDTQVFKPIEANEIDFYNKKVQMLFSYRTLCQEIRRKQIFIEICELLKLKISPLIYKFLEDYELGNRSGIRNGSFFKTEIEKELKNNVFNSFYFERVWF